MHQFSLSMINFSYSRVHEDLRCASPRSVTNYILFLHALQWFSSKSFLTQSLQHFSVCLIIIFLSDYVSYCLPILLRLLAFATISGSLKSPLISRFLLYPLCVSPYLVSSNILHIFSSKVMNIFVYFSVNNPGFRIIKNCSNYGFVDCQRSIMGILFNFYLLFKVKCIHTSAVKGYLVLILICNHFISTPKYLKESNLFAGVCHFIHVYTLIPTSFKFNRFCCH